MWIKLWLPLPCCTFQHECYGVGALYLCRHTLAPCRGGLETCSDTDSCGDTELPTFAKCRFQTLGSLCVQSSSEMSLNFPFNPGWDHSTILCSLEKGLLNFPAWLSLVCSSVRECLWWQGGLGQAEPSHLAPRGGVSTSEL